MELYIFILPPIQIINGSAYANYHAVAIWPNNVARDLSIQLPFAATENVAQERAAIIAALKSQVSLNYPELTVPANPTIRWRI